METLLSTAEAAARLDCTQRHVAWLCDRHDVGRRCGRALILTEADVATLAKIRRENPVGRPAPAKTA